ncbi:MAG: hypothetical protein M1821_010057 [Bathelium mastoideum]|nr:MAG: hypothetical protein M1821_010057 [Bathelium mastoideum]
MVQTLPYDRRVDATMNLGDNICIVILWAHHVCGLTVLVRITRQFEEDKIETKFGRGSPGVILDYDELIWNDDEPASMTLMDVTQDQQLFVFSSVDEERRIEARMTRPAKGLGRRWLERSWVATFGHDLLGKEMGILEVMNISAAMAQIFARKATRASLSSSGLEIYCQSQSPSLDSVSLIADDAEPSGGNLRVPQSRIIDAARFFFDEDRLTAKSTDPYAMIYAGMPFSEIPAPKTIKSTMEKLKIGLDKWDHNGDTQPEIEPLLDCARCISALLLAFAHVGDLEAAARLPLVDESQLLDGDESTARQMGEWDGKERVHVHEMQWFESIASLMVGSTSADPLDNFSLTTTALICDHGWSLFLGTFGKSNPTAIGLSYFSNDLSIKS